MVQHGRTGVTVHRHLLCRCTSLDRDHHTTSGAFRWLGWLNWLRRPSLVHLESLLILQSTANSGSNAVTPLDLLCRMSRDLFQARIIIARDLLSLTPYALDTNSTLLTYDSPVLMYCKFDC